MTPCKWVEPHKQPCPAMAVEGSDFCQAHRDKNLFVRVSGRRKKIDPKDPTKGQTLCMKCSKPIKVGTLAKATPGGLIHAEFVCEP